MQPKRLSVNPEHLNQQIAASLFGQDITSHDRNGKSSLVFLDTNIFLWIFQLGPEARNEFLEWLKELIEEDRLVIPAWVVHEYNSKIDRIEEIVLKPIGTSIKETEGSLRSLRSAAAMLVSDQSLAGTQYNKRLEYLDAWDSAAEDLGKLLKALSKIRKDSRQDARQNVQEIIEATALKTDIFSLSDDLDQRATTRFDNRLAPGHGEDAKKTRNSIGDYVIWNEILERAALSSQSAVLISNDQKPDWVYCPRDLVQSSGPVIQNNGSRVAKCYLPQPYLASEFASRVGEGCAFDIVDSANVSMLLGSNDYNPRDSEKYQNLVAAVSKEAQSSETSMVIGWFLRNEEMITEAVRGVCNWKHSPAEVDLDELANFVTSHVSDLDKESVNWNQIVFELFL